MHCQFIRVKTRSHTLSPIRLSRGKFLTRLTEGISSHSHLLTQNTRGCEQKESSGERKRVKEARGCAEGSGVHGSHRRKGNWGEKVHLGKSGVYVCGLLGVPRHGTRGPFHAPPQLEPRARGEERKETGRRVPVTTESKESAVQGKVVERGVEKRHKTVE